MIAVDIVDSIERGKAVSYRSVINRIYRRKCYV